MSLSILWSETIDSTNEEAKRFLAKSVDLDSQENPIVVAAHVQTAGKGTQGRSWLSNSCDNLYCSWLHLPSEGCEIPATADFTRLAALAVASVLRECYGLPVYIKPINDIYSPLPGNPLQYGKMAGILVESIVQGGQCLGLVTGVGLNLAPVEDLDGLLTTPAVGLSQLWTSDKPLPSKEELIHEIHEVLQPLYIRVFSGEMLPLEPLLSPYALPVSF